MRDKGGEGRRPGHDRVQCAGVLAQGVLPQEGGAQGGQSLFTI